MRIQMRYAPSPSNRNRRVRQSLLCLGLFLTPSTTVGQTYLGASVGVTTSWYEQRVPSFRLTSNQNRQALSAAFTATRALRPWFAVSTGVAWTAKGFDRTEPTFHIRYVEVPLLGFLVVERPTIPAGVSVGGGVAMGRIIHCRRFFTRADGTYVDGCRDPTLAIQALEDEIDRWDFTGEVRARLHVRLASGRLFAEGRYSESLRDTEPDRGGQSVNKLFALMMGYEWRK